MELHAFNALQRHQLEQQESSLRRSKPGDGAIEALSQATRNHFASRKGQLALSKDFMGSTIRRRPSKSVGGGEESFESFLEPQEREQWQRYQDNVQVALYEAKFGYGPRDASEHPLLTSALGKLQGDKQTERDALSLMMANLEKDRSKDQQPVLLPRSSLNNAGNISSEQKLTKRISQQITDEERATSTNKLQTRRSLTGKTSLSIDDDSISLHKAGATQLFQVQHAGMQSPRTSSNGARRVSQTGGSRQSSSGQLQLPGKLVQIPKLVGIPAANDRLPQASAMPKPCTPRKSEVTPGTPRRSEVAIGVRAGVRFADEPLNNEDEDSAPPMTTAHMSAFADTGHRMSESNSEVMDNAKVPRYGRRSRTIDVELDNSEDEACRRASESAMQVLLAEKPLSSPRNRSLIIQNGPTTGPLPAAIADMLKLQQDARQRFVQLSENGAAEAMAASARRLAGHSDRTSMQQRTSMSGRPVPAVAGIVNVPQTSSAKLPPATRSSANFNRSVSSCGLGPVPNTSHSSMASSSRKW